MDGEAWWAAVHGSLRVWHDWVTSLSLSTFMHWRRKWKPTPVFLPGESQGRGSWWAAICGVAQSWTWLKRLSSSSRHKVSLTSFIDEWLFLPAGLSSTDRDVLRSLITTIDVFISPYNSIFFFCIMYFDACSVLRAIPVQEYYIFLKTDPFIIIWCLSLSLVSFLVLNSALSNINIMNPCFFGSVLAWYILIHLFRVYLCFLFVVNSYREHIIENSWFIHSDICFLLFYLDHLHLRWLLL